MTYSKEDVKHASELLGLDSNAEINQIIAKTKELSDKYTMNQSPESFEKLSEIHEASQILLEKSTRSTLGETTLNSERQGALFDPKGNNTFVKNNQNLKKKRMKLAFILSGILLVLIAIAVPIGLSRYRANQYSELEFLMVNFEKFNFEEIGETIDSLPSDYKDMTAIEKQYDLIMREIKMIEDNELSIDYERMRIAYYNLVSMDEDTDDWDLSEYLNNRDNRIQLYGIYWTNTDDYLTYISDYDDPSNYLTGSSLPNNMSEEADYYFTHDENHTLLGYKNKDDVGDRFKAYKILFIDEEQIRFYCYVDKETYTLDAQ